MGSSASSLTLHPLMLFGFLIYSFWLKYSWFTIALALCIQQNVLVIHVCSARPTLCDPVDCSPLGSSVYGILQTRIMGWVAITSSRGSSQPRYQICVSFASCISRLILYHCAIWEAHFSCKYLHIYFFQILFHYKLLQNTEHSSLCCTVGPHQLFSFRRCQWVNGEVIKRNRKSQWIHPQGWILNLMNRIWGETFFIYLQHVSSKIFINYKTKTSKFIVYPWILTDLYGLCLNVLQGSPPYTKTEAGGGVTGASTCLSSEWSWS